MITCAEIPKLTYVPSNPVCMDLSEIKAILEHWADDYGLNLNPDFQRGHVWTEVQQIKFIEYLIRGGTTPPLLFNSPDYGGNRSKKSDLSEEIVIVDGLQRLTACQKFVAGELKVFGGYSVNDFEDKESMLRRICITYLVNHLQTRKDVLTWYLEMNEGHIAHSEEELNRVKGLLENDET
jgi:uncharacterized protein with ParB-like and HNH nuclease domain